MSKASQRHEVTFFLALLPVVLTWGCVTAPPAPAPSTQAQEQVLANLTVAAADITVYARDANVSTMFATPRYVVKGGTLVVEEGQLRRAPRGQRLHVRPEYDATVETPLREFFDRHSTVSFRNYPVGELRDKASPVGRV